MSSCVIAGRGKQKLADLLVLLEVINDGAECHFKPKRLDSSEGDIRYGGLFAGAHGIAAGDPQKIVRCIAWPKMQHLFSARAEPDFANVFVCFAAEFVSRT
ncbi:hypothetical protein C404_24500 [Ralstonia sp. AU12-08]|nr:hypothetical protein C404_24500 [Ralstonia sp. AU12-08]